MEKKKDARKKSARAYEKPILKKLTPEQARLTLFGHAMRHDQGAKDLLEILFAERTSAKDRE